MPHDAPSSPVEDSSKPHVHYHKSEEQPPFYQLSPNILAAATRILDQQEDNRNHKEEDDDEAARISRLRYLDRMQLFQIRDKKERMKRLRQIENQLLNEGKLCGHKRRSSYSCDCCYW
ncbi:hypothetical protein BJ508DRAFT_321005 [Ascobolus immersus RN42]|uniref:Uncharacterized protein n=1 Tax=Ascobolus immersus RN42 TaxID=1160509 RepID=A0A3N4ILW2_ASCIM|nr:hypothetical protein BJ508DRAFT_321005 [Ascobolus immersus RN42]